MSNVHCQFAVALGNLGLAKPTNLGETWIGKTWENLKSGTQDSVTFVAAESLDPSMA